MGWTIREHPVVTESLIFVYRGDGFYRWHLFHFSERISDDREMKLLSFNSWKESKDAYGYIPYRLLCSLKLRKKI